jgi:hypothetical protein
VAWFAQFTHGFRSVDFGAKIKGGIISFEGRFVKNCDIVFRYWYVFFLDLFSRIAACVKANYCNIGVVVKVIGGIVFGGCFTYNRDAIF